MYRGPSPRGRLLPLNRGLQQGFLLSNTATVAVTDARSFLVVFFPLLPRSTVVFVSLYFLHDKSSDDHTVIMCMFFSLVLLWHRNLLCILYVRSVFLSGWPHFLFFYFVSLRLGAEDTTLKIQLGPYTKPRKRERLIGFQLQPVSSECFLYP